MGAAEAPGGRVLIPGDSDRTRENTVWLPGLG